MPVEKQLPLNRPFNSRADIWFWAILIMGNALLFLPNLLFLQPTERYSLNLELTFALVIWVAFGMSWQRKNKNVFWAIFLLFFYIALIYKSYASVLLGIYQTQPNLYNDYAFIANGLPFLLDGLGFSVWIYVAFVGGVLLLFALLWWATRMLLVKSAPLGRITQMVAVSLGLLLFIYSGVSFERGGSAEMPKGVNSLVAEIRQNVRASRTSYQNMDAFMAKNPYAVYDYAQYSLAEKPNIYLIFVESYGSVLYQRDHFRPAYTALMTSFEASLASQGWRAVSALSEAPTWGGGSWMSYTSALFGVDVHEQSQYEALRTKYTQVPYPNMGRYFQLQGYEYTWVVPINRKLPSATEVVEHAFYGADRWVTYESLEYDGPLYGWGPSPPDQYTLGFVNELVRSTSAPSFLFFLTQDSHYPWTPLHERVDDWRNLARLDETGSSLSDDEKHAISYLDARENYLAAIDLSFENINDFISNLDDPNAIIVLIGDHQPPSVSRRDDGFGTMLHIISQDTGFLENFIAYGFEDGLLLENETSRFAHEGFYSLFVRNFLARYGSEPNKLPPYLAEGLN